MPKRERPVTRPGESFTSFTSFTTDEPALSVLHVFTAPQYNPPLSICLPPRGGGLDRRQLGRDLRQLGLDGIPGLRTASHAACTSHPHEFLRVMSAADAFLDDASGRVVAALPSTMKRGFTMVTRPFRGPSEPPGRFPLARTIFRRPGQEYRCHSPGARAMLYLVARAEGVDPSQLHVGMSPTESTSSMEDLPIGVVVCAFSPLVPTLMSPESVPTVELIEYMSPRLKDMVYVQVPFVRAEATFASDIVGVYPPKQAIIELLCTEDLLVCPEHLNRNPPPVIQHVCARLLHGKEQAGVNTFYALHFPYLQLSLDMLRREARRLAPRQERLVTELQQGFSLRESFSDPSEATKQRIRPRRNVSGRYSVEAGARVLRVRPATIEGVPLRVGDHVLLTAQDRVVENGVYRVQSSTPSDGARLQSMRPEDTDAGVNGRELAKCFGASRAQQADDPAACQRAGGVWDHPCTYDSACPFFKRDHVYGKDNVRGGCTNAGYCEMPLGTVATSYHHYTGVPICHNCPDIGNPECCATQPDPQYAFRLMKL